MSGAMNHGCIPGLTYVHSLTENFSAGCPGIIKTCTQGLIAYTYCIMQRLMLIWKKPDSCDLAMERFV